MRQAFRQHFADIDILHAQIKYVNRSAKKNWIWFSAKEYMKEFYFSLEKRVEVNGKIHPTTNHNRKLKWKILNEWNVFVKLHFQDLLIIIICAGCCLVKFIPFNGSKSLYIVRMVITFICSLNANDIWYSIVVSFEHRNVLKHTEDRSRKTWAKDRPGKIYDTLSDQFK